MESRHVFEDVLTIECAEAVGAVFANYPTVNCRDDVAEVALKINARRDRWRD